MKKLNLNYCFRFLTVFLLAVLSACNNGNKSNNNVPQNVQIAGVSNTSFESTTFQSCTFGTSNSYQCTETNLGTTQINFFNSQQELCNQLKNESLNSVLLNGIQMSVAFAVRDRYYTRYCGAYPNTTSDNGLNQFDTNLLRNMKCTMSVEAIDGAFGNTGEMQVPITASGMRGEIYASMFKERSAWIFRLTTTRKSSKYLTVNYVYTKGSGSNGDQLTLRASLNGASAEVTGFAGSEVSLTMDNVDPVTRAEVSCTITDASNAGVQTASNDYRCNVSGTDQVDKAPRAISVSELINNTLTFTSGDSLNSVVMSAEGSFALRQGTAVFTATRNGSKSGIMNITARANLSTPTKFKVKQLSKSVEVSCK